MDPLETLAQERQSIRTMFNRLANETERLSDLARTIESVLEIQADPAFKPTQNRAFQALDLMIQSTENLTSFLGNLGERNDFSMAELASAANDSLTLRDMLERLTGSPEMPAAPQSGNDAARVDWL